MPQEPLCSLTSWHVRWRVAQASWNRHGQSGATRAGSATNGHGGPHTFWGRGLRRPLRTAPRDWRNMHSHEMVPSRGPAAGTLRDAAKLTEANANV